FTSGGFVDTKALPQSGAYSILVDPAAAATGTVTLQLYDVPPDVTGSIVAGGSPGSVTLASPGPNAALTINRQARPQPTVKVGPNCCRATVTVKNPDGSTLAASSFSSFGGSLSGKVLQQTGQHTILIDPQGAATGTITLTLSLV